MTSRDALPPVGISSRASGSGLAGHGVTYLNRLNDVHLGSQLAVEALADLLSCKKAATSPFVYFRVPTSGGGSGGIRRRMSDVIRLLNDLIGDGEYGKSLLLMVSITEDYVQSVLRIVLTAHPEHLARGLNGGRSEVALPLLEVLEKGLEPVVAKLVEDRLQQLFYASPEEYLTCVSAFLGIRLNKAIVSAFVEAKATRDIFVHANGVANETYLRKAGQLRRASVGEALPVDQQYFDGCITVMKDLVDDIRVKLSTKYDDDPSIRRALAKLRRRQA